MARVKMTFAETCENAELIIDMKYNGRACNTTNATMMGAKYDSICEVQLEDSVRLRERANELLAMADRVDELKELYGVE